MQTAEMIPAEEFCVHHNIEISFIYSLKEAGLIEITTVEEKTYVPVSELQHLEKLVHFHYDLDINLEGIETITHLLQRIHEMQQKIVQLSNRLNLYENEQLTS